VGTRCTPTAVLMITGQTAVMKMTKIADGWASRNAASDSGSHASGRCAPASNHSSKNCRHLMSQAASRLERSQRLQAGTTRRSGMTIQSVMANTKRPSGWLKGMRWACMARRSKQVPATRPAITSSTRLTIWKIMGKLLARAMIAA